MYMDVNQDEYVVRQNDHLLIFQCYINDMTLEENTFTRPCASIYKATKFGSADEAKIEISKVKAQDLSDTEVVQIKDIVAEQKAKADKESDEMIKNAWHNTSRAKQEEMLENLRNNRGEEAVQEWLNKYGPLNEIDDSETV